MKYCIVPRCTVNSKSDPGKRFVALPSDKRRKAWLQAIKTHQSEKTVSLICEDHFEVRIKQNSLIYIKFL